MLKVYQIPENIAGKSGYNIQHLYLNFQHRKNDILVMFVNPEANEDMLLVSFN